jgi:SAM-dependent methyltransferase
MNTPPQVFDRAVYIHRQCHASGDALALLDQRVTEELQDRLTLINRAFDKVLVIAPRAANFAEALRGMNKCKSVMAQEAEASENLGLAPDTFHAVISLLDLHAVNDVPGYVVQVAQALKPDGLALFGFFAGESLRELREAWLQAEQQVTGGASPRVAPMIDLRETGGLLQRAGLALPVADMDQTHVRYADCMSLMREIKQLGFSNCLSDRRRSLTTAHLLMQAALAYPQDPDARITATVQIAWAAAWKPHASQQQPLKPGSAKARLADALKLDETKL